MVTNPYSTPQGELVKDSDGYADANWFTVNTRIGRLRYLARLFVFYLAVSILAALIAPMTASESGAMIGTLVSFAVIIFFVVMSFIFGIQRLHDLDKSGWLVLLTLIPLVNLIIGLYMMFARGTEGGNDYGPPPPPNTTWVWVGGLMFPLVFILGILAAIALPAYQDYVERARAAQTQ